MTRSLKFTSCVAVPFLVAVFTFHQAEAKKPPKDPPPQSPVRYRILYLNPLTGMDWATCTDMNDLGEIVGRCGGPAGRRYFLFLPNADFTGGEMVDIDTLFPSEPTGIAYETRSVCGINNRRQIAGTASQFLAGEYVGKVSFRLSPSQNSGDGWHVETLPWVSDMKDMNEDGDVVGGVYSVVVWPEGSSAYVDLGTLYNEGELARGNLISGRDADGFVTLAGEVGSQDGTFVFRYRIGGNPQSPADLQKSLMPGLADSTMTGASGMNDQGHIVGDAYVKGRWVWHATLYRSDTDAISDLGTLGGEDSVARNINEFEDIIGMSDVQANKTTSAFLLTSGVMWNLADLIDRDENGQLPYGMFGGNYLVYDRATINNLRFICGPSGDYDDQNRAYVLVPYVPE